MQITWENTTKQVRQKEYKVDLTTKETDETSGRPKITPL